MTNGAASPPSRRQRAAEWAGNRASDLGGGVRRAGSGLASGAGGLYNAAASGAPVVAGKGKNVAVKVLNAFRTRAQVPFVFALLVIIIQATDFYTDFNIDFIWRAFAYFSIAIVAIWYIGLPKFKSVALSALGLGLPHLWEYILPYIKDTQFSMVANAALLLATTAWTWSMVLSPETNLPGLIRVLFFFVLAYGIIWPPVEAAIIQAGWATEKVNLGPEFTIKPIMTGLKTSLNTASRIPNSVVSTFFDRTIKGATGDFYTGEVDKNVRAPLGVSIEKLEPADQEYQEGEKVTMWTTLKARTLEEPVRIIPKCWSDKGRGDELPGIILPAEIEVDSFESDIFNCRFERLKPGKRVIKASATFNFETNAYVKSYFMDKDRLRSLRREQIEPLDFYKITDKNPSAVFTNGPVMVEMSVPEPPVGLKPGDLNRVFIGAKLSNNWEGRIESVTDFRFELPKGFELAGEDACGDYVFRSEGSGEDGYNVYVLDIAAARADDSEKFTNIDKFQTFKCLVKVNDDEIPNVLGGTPISIKYFGASAKYVYSVEKEASLEVKRKETDGTVPGGEGTGQAGEMTDKPINTEDAVAVIKEWAAKYGVPAKIALQVGFKEGGLQHYAKEGRPQTEKGVKTGDEGCSIGVMQINTCAHPECRGIIAYDPNSRNMCMGSLSCAGTNVEDLRCNVEAAMKLLESHYKEWQTKPLTSNPDCTCGGKYSGWDYALKRYNGCDCRKTYVEVVNNINVDEYLV